MHTPPANEHPGNNLDLLRLLFASLVLFSHAPELIDGNRSRELLSMLTGNVDTFGRFAVNGFFALSGYLIMASWFRQPQLRNFFKNRVLRIYPAFIVAFCLSVLLVGPFAAPNASVYFNQFTTTRYLFSMLTLREPWFAESFQDRFLGGASVNGAMWTISYEFFCYVAVAIVGCIARKRLRLVWFLLSAILLILSCFLPELEPIPQINRFYVAPLVKMSAVFFAGGSLYLLNFKGLKSAWKIIAVGILFFLTWFSARFYAVGFAIFGSVFFLSVGLAKARLSWARAWPDISYGTYLYGWPIICLVIWALPELGPWPVFGLSLTLSLICGYLSWTFIEAPFMKLKTRTLPRVISI